ncbi:hypothetical protein GRX03_02385 [Halovenus sp. WSH3]|uniref:Uncharacterized protein n=1 Tax=Halovenus carboxidivorans TaxID=2692199 RepID=A0A6B0SY34_9EURY|nr:ABC transporter permease [Halovenus carboxidivorans]MXR50454.1 hypothetical protein [Halovenus carboxidivorans]
MGGVVTASRLRLTELARQPLTLGLLVALPPVVIELYGTSMESFPRLPTLGADPAVAGRLTGALFAVAFLAGLVGLFQVISAREGDERLAVAGFPHGRMLASRLVAMCVVALLGAVVSFGTLSYRVEVASPVLAFAALVLAAAIYGLLGVIVGTLVPRELEGSIVLVFLADFDNVLSSGLFSLTATVPVPFVGDVRVAETAPLYHPRELFTAAVLDGTLAGEHLAPIALWIVGLLVVAVLAYGRSTQGPTERLAGWSA